MYYWLACFGLIVLCITLDIGCLFLFVVVYCLVYCGWFSVLVCFDLGVAFGSLYC